MKKLAVIILAVIGVALGTNLTASAVDGYPPGTQVSVTAPSAQNPVAPGGTFNLAVNNVPPNTTVKVTFNGVTYSATSGAAGGTVTIPNIKAPATAGSFPVSVLVGTNTTAVTGAVAVGTTAVTTTVATTIATTTTTMKPTNTVPATGSSTTFTGIAIGLPLLVGGLALLVVSRRRRPIGA